MSDPGQNGGFPFLWWSEDYTSDGAFPMSGGKSAPRVVSAVADDSTHVRVTFSAEMNLSDVEDETNYSFLGSVLLTPTSATRVQVAPSIVVITVNEMTDGTSYTVEVDAGVRDIAGQTMDPANRTAGFTGIGVQPQVSGAVALDSTTVRITFNEPMKNDANLTDINSYVIAGPTSPTNISVNRISSTQVDLTLTELRDGGAYTVTVLHVVDLAENVIDPAHDDANFTGIGVAPQVDPSATIVDEYSVYVDYSETVNVSQASNAANYSVVPTLGAITVTQITGTRYKLTFANLQIVGQEYVITVTNVTDLVGNLIDPAHDEASFFGFSPSPPMLFFYPGDDLTDVAPREFLRVQAVDRQPNSSGIDVSSWSIDITYEATNGNIVNVVVLDNGVPNPLFETEFTGDALDAEDGIFFRFRPLAGHWDENTHVEVYAEVSDNDGIASNDEWDIYFGDFLCFENDLPTVSTFDQTLIDGFVETLPNTDQLRRIIMQVCTESTALQVRARTLFWYAVQTELRPLIASVVDVGEVEDIRLCNRTNVMVIHAALVQNANVVSSARQEILALVGERSLRPVLEFLASESPLHVVSAAATLVILGATAGV